MLEDRPTFETEAEAAMVASQKALEIALVDIKAAIIKFRKLKVENENGESKKDSKETRL